MDKLINGAFTNYNETTESLKAKFGSIRIADELSEFLKRCKKQPGGEGGEADYDNDVEVYVAILSDANDYFISWILEHNQLSHCFDEIITNPVELRAEEPSVFRIVPLFQPHHEPHNCVNKCPPNMCKGLVLKHLLAGRKFSVSLLKSNPTTSTSASSASMSPSSPEETCIYDQVVYIGDGGNDYCPSTLLRPTDAVCVRAGYRLESVITSRRDQIKSQKVLMWKDYKELASHLHSLVYSHQ